VIAETFGVGQFVYTILWFFLFVIEIWLMFLVFTDIFRSHDLKGWAKALWVLFVLVVPLIGILTYLIVRGDKMEGHAIEMARQNEAAFRQYVQSAVRRPTNELAELVDLKERGVLTEEEFERMKRSIVDNASAAA
jgi:Tfp pilus assembly protein PilO